MFFKSSIKTLDSNQFVQKIKYCYTWKLWHFVATMVNTLKTLLSARFTAHPKMFKHWSPALKLVWRRWSNNSVACTSCLPWVTWNTIDFRGLDSSSTLQIVSLLKGLARGGRNVICTLHQPSATIFEMFDHIYIIGRGYCMYQGSSRNMLPFLQSVGLPCPQYHNPADFSKYNTVMLCNGMFSGRNARGTMHLLRVHRLGALWVASA